MCPAVEEASSSSSTITIEIPAPAAAARSWLVEVQDDEGARRSSLSATAKLVVGTSPQADIVVRDPTVSARHCALKALGAGVAIEDLGSRNGTYVGGARVIAASAGIGTVVTIGRSSFVVFPSDAGGASDAASGSSGDSAREPGPPLAGIAGSSLAMRRLADQVRRLARHALPVLVSGESGTGKELIARALHAEGPRRSRPFIAINVTALPRELVESELFGHERGAFTGAHARREGAFSEAEGGTLFLDEIGDLPIEAQPKLLRALDGYEVRRVGAAGGGQRADVRVVAATHTRLEQRVARGEFRRDLFHRLECLVVTVPPLRERRGDIGAIARDLLRPLAREMGPRILTPAALGRLSAHDWPGNVRELRNVLCRAVDATPAGSRIEAEHIDRALRRDIPAVAKCMTSQRAQELLRESSGNLSAAARAAGMPRTSFRKLLGA
ncbi:MAG TPA: sigma 54-interacting transcriptional regulator [Polyangiaceae bacterium]|nr:sigma 54-interacting transcriptional regulator [Polyangiaceae bacterium]